MRLHILPRPPKVYRIPITYLAYIRCGGVQVSYVEISIECLLYKHVIVTSFFYASSVAFAILQLKRHQAENKCTEYIHFEAFKS